MNYNSGRFAAYNTMQDVLGKYRSIMGVGRNPGYLCGHKCHAHSAVLITFIQLYLKNRSF